MSGANKLIEKILAEANSQAETVLAEAEQRAAEISAKGVKEAEAKKKSLLDNAKVQGEERKRRAHTIAELDARKAILAAKEQMIEDTFAQAIGRLQKVDKKAYEDMIYPMLLVAVETGTEEIIVAADDQERYTPELLEKANKALIAQGKQGKLTLSAETREVKGGFILRSGDMEINSSFDAILRMQRDRLEPDVAAILFA
ncbi:MAG: hypothetical protein KGZ63_02705 [Clostridiales bacterium]|jgi:V/A-type H+-transporting ATPase subunit E|nr:hypothetical protein [Clostridiales bacterium]